MAGDWVVWQGRGMVETTRRVVHTTCNRDCPDACGIVAEVAGERIVRLRGDPAHPVTRGFLCYRTQLFLERQYAPERLTEPLIRRGDRLEPATLDEALDLCARELVRIRAESGPAAILHYRSGGSLGLLKGAVDLFFEHFGPVTTKRGDICSGAGDAAQLADFGESDSNDLEDLLAARAVILWGKNPHTSSPHLVPLLLELRRRGARLALVDPVRHRAADLCELVVQPRPGGDFALALAVSRILLERGWIAPDAASFCENFNAWVALVRSRSLAEMALAADVPLATIEALAELYGTSPPANIQVGWGMQRRRNGAAIVRALDALGTVSGNVGVSGGGVSYYYKRRGAFDTSAFCAARPAPRTIPEPLLGRGILAANDPPIRAVWITAGNPVVMLPESETTARALASREFVVVVDSFLTDTAKLANVVLPTTTLLEDDDLVGAYGHHYLGAVVPVAPPPGAARTDLEIVQELAARVGLGPTLSGAAAAWKQRLLGEIPLTALTGRALRNPVAPRVVFADRRFATPSGRARLITEWPAPAADRPAGSLLLQALSTPASQSSQWSPREPDETLEAVVHPDAAGGIPDGARARLRNRFGSLEVRLRHEVSARRDTVTVPKGGSLGLGRCANALTGGVLTDLGEGAALYEEPVFLEPSVDT